MVEFVWFVFWDFVFEVILRRNRWFSFIWVWEGVEICDRRKKVLVV